jgi:hypothetical protein
MTEQVGAVADSRAAEANRRAPTGETPVMAGPIFDAIKPGVLSPAPTIGAQQPFLERGHNCPSDVLASTEM